MSIFNWAKNSQGRFVSSYFNWEGLDQHQKLDRLEKFYGNNALYAEIEKSAYYNDEWVEAIKPLRNPTNRSVEFFASKLCQGAPKITVLNNNQEITDSINKFLAWSNFETEKRKMLRKNALHGNLFLKLNFDGEKVYENYVDARNVTSFKEDARGNITEFRIDIDLGDGLWYTEYWLGGTDGYVATWQHRLGRNIPLDQLGDAQSVTFLSAYGIDFVPVVHSKFRDTGEPWGKSCVDHAIVKIVNVDREVTRLSSLVFLHGKPIFAVTSSGRDANGRPFPLKRITRSNVNQNTSDDNMFLYVEGGDIKDMTWKPSAEVLAKLRSDEEELEKDLPELKYYTLKENQLSGIAIRTLLAGALDRGNEAQENFNNAQERMNEMALTMGKFFGVFPASIGDFARGDFKHQIAFEEIIPIQTRAEKITSYAQIKDDASMTLQEKLLLCGFNPEELPASATSPSG